MGLLCKAKIRRSTIFYESALIDNGKAITVNQNLSVKYWLMPNFASRYAQVFIFFLASQDIPLFLGMKRIGRHVLFWVCYVLLKVLLNITSDASTLEFSDKLWNETLLHLSAQLVYLPIFLTVVYPTFHLIDQYFSNELRLTRLISITSLFFIIGVLFMNWANHLVILPRIYNMPVEFWAFHPGSLLYHGFNLGAVLAISCTVKLARKQAQSKIIEHNLLREKSEAELKFLKSQLNPHFLFNTLNNIYSLARKNSPQTSEAIIKLSKLMRFMLYETSGKDILLTDEIKVITDYIELEKLRYSNRLKLYFDFKTDNPLQRIAPLLLIHFVENLFKHGVSETQQEVVVTVNIELSNSVLNAQFFNPIHESGSTSSESPIGMENIRRQLNLLYPKHSLVIDQANNLFSVYLTIPL